MTGEVERRFAEAARMQQGGRLAEAEAACRKALKRAPAHARGWMLLGVVVARQGRLPEACGHFRKAAAAQPRDPEIHYNLGLALAGTGELAGAAESYGRTLALMPGHVLALNNLGVIHRKAGRLEDAVACFRSAAATDPRFVPAQGNLAAALLEVERAGEALAACETLLALAPDNPRAHLDKGRALAQLQRPAEALACHERAAALAPGNPEALIALGNALWGAERAEDALAAFDRAAATGKRVAEAEDNRGLLLRESGRFEEAAAAFRKALGATPAYCRSWRHLAELKRFAPGDPDLARMKGLHGDARLPAAERTQLCFALGKAHDDAGDPERAFERYREGNALKRRGLDPELAREAEAFRGLRDVFTPEYLNAGGGGADSELPVFVLGMPRSGTSLVEQILASHPAVHGAGELMLLRRLVRALSGTFPGNLAGLDAAEGRRLGEDYLTGLRALAPSAGRITDKMPRNFQLIGLIHRILPGARIVHCRRNPLDTCLSCYTRLFRNGQAFSYDLAELGRYYRLYDELMAHWRKVLPGRFLEINYEALVADPRPQVEALLAHCGLDWDDRCLAPHETTRTVRTASAAQVRRPLYGSSVDRWRRFEAQLGPLIEALGPLAERAREAWK